MQLAQNRDGWRNLVNTVMNLRVLAPRSYTGLLVAYRKKVACKVVDTDNIYRRRELRRRTVSYERASW
jgi:hypothetical protein